jgi:hypothetical protein
VPEPVRLRENGDPVIVSLNNDTAAALNASRLVTVEPSAGGQ